MKKDIKPPKVEKVSVAVVESTNNLGKKDFDVYLINEGDASIEGVLVSSKGYGMNVNTGEKVETTMLRHFLDEMEPQSFKKIEPIMEEVLGLTNEYWVSYYLNKEMYDKKFVFVAESIHSENYIDLPLIGKRGVLIR